jgi:hypothetical protein
MRKEGGTKGKQGNEVGNPAIGKGEAFERLCELTPPPIRMDCSFSLKDEN